MTLNGLTVNTIVHTLKKENPESAPTLSGLFLHAWTDAHLHNKIAY
jgi:hypothetical protein